MERGSFQFLVPGPEAQTETQKAPSEHQETLLHRGLTEHWHMLPKDVVDCPALEIFKSHLDTVLGKQL